MSDNNYDVTILQQGTGYKVSVSYYHFCKGGEDKKLSSVTTYRWYTDCKEIIDWCARKKTKIFYSQLRVLCRNYGKKENFKFNR